MSDRRTAGSAEGVGVSAAGADAVGGVAAADPRAGRLGGLLQELLHTHGRLQTAELLGVSERTLRRAESGGDGRGLSEQLCKALEGYEAELPGSGALPQESALELAGLNRRVDKLEKAVTEDLPEVKAALERLAASVEALQQQVEVLQPDGGATRSAASPQARSPARAADIPLRPYPQLVTSEAEAGEERVYGRALPVITEWRRARRKRERASTTLERLRADERLLELELELVGEHHLTLPPAERPWDGLRRQGELRLLNQSLTRVRRRRRRAQLRRWGLRLLTLGLWGRRPA